MKICIERELGAVGSLDQKSQADSPLTLSCVSVAFVPVPRPPSPSSRQGTKKAAVRILKNFDEAITVDASSLDPEVLYQRPYAG